MSGAIVYRVQDSEGRGPWRPGFSHVWIEPRDDHKFLVSCLEQFDIKQLPTNRHIGCGCLTKDQLRRWFTESEYMKLRLFGYSAVEMGVDEVVFRSSIQCMFERKKPLATGVVPIELYDL